MTRPEPGDAPALKPFADESEVRRIGDLTIENRTDQVSLYGSLDLTRDQSGLRHARALKRIVEAIVHALETQTDLPEAIAAPEPPERTKNPFT
jgi:hypothetical protein